VGDEQRGILVHLLALVPGAGHCCRACTHRSLMDPVSDLIPTVCCQRRRALLKFSPSLDSRPFLIQISDIYAPYKPSRRRAIVPLEFPKGRKGGGKLFPCLYCTSANISRKAHKRAFFMSTTEVKGGSDLQKGPWPRVRRRGPCQARRGGRRSRTAC